MSKEQEKSNFIGYKHEKKRTFDGGILLEIWQDIQKDDDNNNNNNKTPTANQWKLIGWSKQQKDDNENIEPPNDHLS